MVELSSEAAAHAVEVAPCLWWVGDVLAGDPFQCHAYLIEAGDESVVVDPGSTLTIETTLRKIEEVVPLESVRTIVVHHSDPDVCDGLHAMCSIISRPDVRLVTEWRSALLLKHLALPLAFETIEDLDWHLDLPEGRRLEFALTPYLHFPGAFVTFDRSTGSLLSSDLFGGFNRAGRLWATGPDDFEDLRQFHEHYMPSREIVIAGLGTIINRFGPIQRVLPQHGYLIPGPLVASMFEQLSRLECGVMLASRSDTHLARLLTVAGSIRRIEDILEEVSTFDTKIRQIERELMTIMPLESVAVDTRVGDQWLRFDADNPIGKEVEGPSQADDTHLTLQMRDRPDAPDLLVVLQTSGPFTPMSELDHLLHLVAGRIRHVIDEAIDHRMFLERELNLRTAANTDPLTGLLNRRALDEWAAVPPSAAVLMVDIDRFKAINDTYGHAVGDRALRGVADVIRSSLRRTDRAFRFGGEEFVVVVELDRESTDDAATALGERIRQLVESVDPRDLGIDHPITVSIGVDRVDASEALAPHIRHADRALYAAKALGRNRVVMHHD